MLQKRMLPVWFFVGVLLFNYGIIILATGFWELHRPSRTMFEEDHPEIWGGLILLLIGGAFTARFRPRYGR